MFVSLLCAKSETQTITRIFSQAELIAEFLMINVSSKFLKAKNTFSHGHSIIFRSSNDRVQKMLTLAKVRQ